MPIVERGKGVVADWGGERKADVADQGKGRVVVDWGEERTCH